MENLCYLTPEHYMGMQWNQMANTGGYKEHGASEYVLFAKACVIDKVCWYVFTKDVGQDLLKWSS
jgi:hypothetical protein